jgi:ABC-type dipeptide/oligopeptide/nickel transport system permease component
MIYAHRAYIQLTLEFVSGKLLPNSRFAIMRSPMFNLVGATYLTAVHAEGLRERTIIFRHAARNAAHHQPIRS